MKKKAIIIIIILLMLLLIPIPLKLKDGGTMTYNAVLYRIVVWHSIDDSQSDGYKTGTEIHLIPNNFKDLHNH